MNYPNSLSGEDKMQIGILQPGYLPWLGFFEQVYKSELFVVYDDVQYDKHGWRNRNRIKTANGVQWITVPVLTRGQAQPIIKDVLIDNSSDWRRKHLASLNANYSKAKYFNEYIGLFQKVYAKEWKYLFDLDIHFIQMLLSELNLKRKMVLSSDLGIEGDRISRLIGICKHFKADSFYEGQAGKNYLEDEVFLQAGIKIVYQDYQHPEYSQLYGEFIPYLSIVDLLFNEGKKSLAVITGDVLE